MAFIEYLTTWPYRFNRVKSLSKSEGGRDEWDGKAQGIEAQKKDPLKPTLGCGCNDKHGRQGRPHARGPSERERDPYDDGTDEAKWFLLKVDSLLLVQKRRFYQAQVKKAHHDEE